MPGWQWIDRLAREIRVNDALDFYEEIRLRVAYKLLLARRLFFCKQSRTLHGFRKFELRGQDAYQGWNI